MIADASAVASTPRFSPTTIFSPVSTPAHDVYGLSLFALTIGACIFVLVISLLIYALVKFRARPGDTREPAQVFGSTQIELSWTIIPILIIMVLFLGTTRVIFKIQDAQKPKSALDVVVIGHQFWWEFRYPGYNVSTANELHVPVSKNAGDRPTFLKLTSADVVHSFWIPRLAGKTDLLPNRVNEMWVDPQTPGLYEGQCAQFCGVEHAKMLLRVYVDTPEQFEAWIADQQRVAVGAGAVGAGQGIQTAALRPVSLPTGPNAAVERQGEERGAEDLSPASTAGMSPAEVGRQTFEHQACINCHTVRGTVADGRFGPDLTHLMSRSTIAAGAAQNTPADLRRWIENPDDFKKGALMPPMHLTQEQNDQITTYLLTLK